MNKIKRKIKELFIYFLRKIEIKSIHSVYLFFYRQRMRSFINAKISGFRSWIIPEPLIPRQEDRRLGERDWAVGCFFICSSPQMIYSIWRFTSNTPSYHTQLLTYGPTLFSV